MDPVLKAVMASFMEAKVADCRVRLEDLERNLVDAEASDDPLILRHIAMRNAIDAFRYNEIKEAAKMLREFTSMMQRIEGLTHLKAHETFVPSSEEELLEPGRGVAIMAAWQSNDDGNVQVHPDGQVRQEASEQASDTEVADTEVVATEDEDGDARISPDEQASEGASENAWDTEAADADTRAGRPGRAYTRAGRPGRII